MRTNAVSPALIACKADLLHGVRRARGSAEAGSDPGTGSRYWGSVWEEVCRLIRPDASFSADRTRGRSLRENGWYGRDHVGTADRDGRHHRGGDPDRRTAG